MSRSGGGPAGPATSAKRKSPLWAKLLVFFGAVIMVGGGGGLIVVPVLLGQVGSSIQQVNLLGDTGAKGTSINGAINMLLVGLDTRDDNPGMGSRSDSIIIAHIPASHNQVYMVSIPRDTNAEIPAFPKTGYRGGSAKINAAFFFGSMNKGGDAGGFQLLAMTIKKMTGITFNGGAIVNFDGFKDIVTKLGGVDMYVDETTISLHHGYLKSNPSVHAAPFKIHPDGTPGPRIPGTAPVIYKKGVQHLSPYAALDFVRCRDFLPYTDYDRQRHQQQFIKALLKEAYDKGMSDPLKLNSFLTSISKAFIFDRNGISIDDWIFTLKSINPSSIVTIKTNNGVYNHYTGPAPDDRQALTADSMTLLHDVLIDRVGDFTATHPSWVA